MTGGTLEGMRYRLGFYHNAFSLLNWEQYFDTAELAGVKDYGLARQYELRFPGAENGHDLRVYVDAESMLIDRLVYLKSQEGAGLLKASGLGPIPLMISFLLLAALINLSMGSASAKWAFMAPVFIPMFMLLGYSPELVQGVYRIGDSSTNLISPMMSFFALIVAFVQRYDSKAGIGTVIATMLPYSVAFLIVWIILLVFWLLLGLPLGPGAGLYLAG